MRVRPGRPQLTIRSGLLSKENGPVLARFRLVSRLIDLSFVLNSERNRMLIIPAQRRGGRTARSWCRLWEAAHVGPKDVQYAVTPRISKGFSATTWISDLSG